MRLAYSHLSKDMAELNISRGATNPSVKDISRIISNFSPRLSERRHLGPSSDVSRFGRPTRPARHTFAENYPRPPLPPPMFRVSAFHLQRSTGRRGMLSSRCGPRQYVDAHLGRAIDSSDV